MFAWQEELDPGALEFEPTQFGKQASSSRTVELPRSQPRLCGGQSDRAKPQATGKRQARPGRKIENRDGDGGFQHVGSVRWDAMNERIRIELREAPIELPVRAADGEDGAACSFRGTTRAETHAEHGDLVALEYEAHAAMAITQLRTLAEEVLEEFGLGSLSIIHATGRVPVGQPSVLIEATSGHRDEAFLGCRAAIDRLKQRVPIFKIECWAGGRTRPDGVTPRPDRIDFDPQGD